MMKHEKICTKKEIVRLTKMYHENYERIVFTNGCFDILHAGHAQYLQQAKEIGDILIVGINSDSSVKKLKGDERPINSQKERAYLLACLEFVDHVVIFNEETPYNLIKAIVPDYLVKGGDWKPEDIVGSDIVWENAGDVKSLPFLKGFSTTSTIERIKQLTEK